MAETIGDAIYRTVVEIHRINRTVTRELIAETMNIKASVVDDNMKRLIDEQKLVRVTRGVYAPAQLFPEDRAVSVTMLSDGTVKLEVGDEIINLTPREARNVGMGTIGFTIRVGF